MYLFEAMGAVAGSGERAMDVSGCGVEGVARFLLFMYARNEEQGWYPTMGGCILQMGACIIQLKNNLSLQQRKYSLSFRRVFPAKLAKRLATLRQAQCRLRHKDTKENATHFFYPAGRQAASCLCAFVRRILWMAIFNFEKIASKALNHLLVICRNHEIQFELTMKKNYLYLKQSL